MNSPEKHFVMSDIFLRSWHPYFWLVLIASLLYVQILTFSEYTHHDDYYLIVGSFSHINKLSDIGHAFLEDVSHQGQGGNLYRPLLTISFMLSAQISGIMPFGYHLIDIILHCISCCLLFVTFQMMGFKRSISFFGSLVFCVHPALTQAVAWIPGRNDSLLAVFILLCFISFIKFLSTSCLKWYFFHLLFFLLAMFTKETSVVFPALALLFFYCRKGKEIISITTILFVVGWGIVLFNWHILRSAAMITPVGDKFQAAALVLSSLPIALHYCGNVFWPIHLAFAPISSDIHITAGIISTGLLSLALLLSERRDWKLIIFGVVWFVAFLIPTFYYDITVRMPLKFYEHRIYVPLIGILFVLLSFSFSHREQFLTRIIPYAAMVIICVFSWLSYAHTFDFKNSLALSEYDAATSPNDPRRYYDITRMNIPKKLDSEIRTIQDASQSREIKYTSVTKEELGKIIDNVRDELKSNPQDPELHHALAVAYFARGLLLSSEENFFTAMRGKLQDAAIPYNLGILYYSADMRSKAEKAWQDALRIDPAMGNAHLNLSFLYYEASQYTSAWDHCQKAMQLGIAVPSSFVNEIRRNLF